MIVIRTSNKVYLEDPPESLLDKVKAALTLQNPAYLDAEKMNRWTGNLKKDLHFYEQNEIGLAIPRGCFPSLKRLCQETGETLQIIDRRRTHTEVDFSFTGVLRDFQEEAVENMTGYDIGTLCAPTGSGKTVMALAIIAKRRQPTLIVVHTKELLSQWRDRIETFLGIPKADIGLIGGGKKTIGKQITIGIVNSIYPIAETLKYYFGHLVVDECHRCPSRTFTEAVSAFDCRYLLGLSATPYRRDQLTKVIFWYLGQVGHKIEQQQLEAHKHIVPAEVIFRHTDFHPCADTSEEYSRALCELTQDTQRNTLIAGDVVLAAQNGTGACLVLTDRKEHAQSLSEAVEKQGVTTAVLTGDVSAKERTAIVGRLNAGEIPVLIATGQLIGEGFDCKGLTTLFLATPVSYHGRLVQYLGRVLRPAPGKSKAKVYDYVDPDGVLMAGAQKRLSVYRNNNWITN